MWGPNARIYQRISALCYPQRLSFLCVTFHFQCRVWAHDLIFSSITNIAVIMPCVKNQGHLVALEHLFEEYEAWKVLDNEQAVEAKTQRVFHSISVIKLLLTPPRVGASSPRHHGPSDRPSPFRSGSSFLRSHVASSPESSCGQRTSQKQAQQALVHLGFADLIDTAFDIPSECDDFPSWWWNAPG